MNVVTVRLGVRRILKYAVHRYRMEGGVLRPDLGYIRWVTGAVEGPWKDL
jgi:hypothetical protein